MEITIAQRLGDVSQYKFNPAGIQAAAVNAVSAMYDGSITLVDPSNPFVQALENSAINTAAWMIEDAALTRKSYPAAAQTVEDIYPHMSDKDYVNRFAVPTSGKFLFFYSYDEILNKLVVDPDNSGIKKLIIPRNTYVTVNEVVFSLQYPIEIRQMAHGGLEIVYDVSVESPLQTLATNIINWKIINAPDGTPLVSFEVLLTQFSVNSVNASPSSATGFVTTLPLTDSFYYCRVYVNEGNGVYTEMLTTHTEEIYDPAQLTAALKVLDGQLVVRIPQIYLTTAMLQKSIRIDVYETKGVLSMNLLTYRPEQYIVKYEAWNPSEKDQFVAPLSTMQLNYVMSAELINGGRAALSFEELRARVIKNAIGDPNIPVTPSQIEAALSDDGYSVVKNIDNITNRIYLAARPMPDPQASELITAAGGGINTLSTTMDDAVQLSTVVDNGTIVTIKPETLYKSANGVVTLVPDAEVNLINAMAPDQKAIAVNNGNYAYSPFYFVLDSSGVEFAVRPYHLDTPIIESRSFEGENDTTLLQVATDLYSIMRTATGYVVEIQTKSSDEWKALDDSEVAVHLAYIPTGDVDRAYVQGILMGKSAEGERIYHFPLDTTWRLDSNNEMQMSSFLMFNDTPRNVNLPLLTNFDVLYSSNTPRGPQWVVSSIDSLLPLFDLPDDSYAITQEKFSIRLGYYLDKLWARARTIVGAENYERWAVDVPAKWEQDVYESDPATGAAFDIIDGQLVYRILHHAGDPKLDGQNNPIYLHRVGDVKTDAYGNPIITKQRTLVRQIDLMLVEGTYYFATNQVAADYRDFIRATIVDRVINDMSGMNNNLLELTSIYYYPTTSIGQIRVLFSNGLETYLDAGQTFRVTLYVNSSVYNNPELRATLTTNTVRVLSNQLSQRVVSMSNCIDALRSSFKEDVISIELSGLGGDKNLNVVTVIDDAQRLALKKTLITRNDETLGISEGVTVDFVLHERVTNA